mmetsp:Transcript_115650/g.323409  ORF Transcript_115650/g.323409 Transcript_115650/m.323409 type:complete len:228 (+) Transcript_115650:165-848(+)
MMPTPTLLLPFGLLISRIPRLAAPTASAGLPISPRKAPIAEETAVATSKTTTKTTARKPSNSWIPPRPAPRNALSHPPHVGVNTRLVFGKSMRVVNRVLAAWPKKLSPEEEVVLEVDPVAAGVAVAEAGAVAEAADAAAGSITTESIAHHRWQCRPTGSKWKSWISSSSRSNWLRAPTFPPPKMSCGVDSWTPTMMATTRSRRGSRNRSSVWNTRSSILSLLLTIRF